MKNVIDRTKENIEEQLRKDYPTYESVIKLVMRLEIEVKGLIVDIDKRLIKLEENKK